MVITEDGINIHFPKVEFSWETWVFITGVEFAVGTASGEAAAVGSASVTCKNAFSAEQEQRPSCSQEGVGGEETEAIGGHGSFYTFGRKRKNRVSDGAGMGLSFNRMVQEGGLSGRVTLE